MKFLFSILFFGLLITKLPAQIKIIVSADGNGCYKTIQEAINSLPDSSAEMSTIFIKDGMYKEKLFVKKPNIVFEGESR